MRERRKKENKQRTRTRRQTKMRVKEWAMKEREGVRKDSKNEGTKKRGMSKGREEEKCEERKR